MKELFVPALIALVVKLIADIGFSVKASEFQVSTWVNENLIRVIFGVLAITLYVLYMSEGETPETIIVKVISGEWFLYGITKRMGMKGALPKVMKKMGAKPKG